ncbi:hypothetical protein RQP46_003827 [Phenoliferia psychrophenolica]
MQLDLSAAEATLLERKVESSALEERDAVVARLFCLRHEHDHTTKEVATLQASQQGFMEQIITLEASNAALKAENERLKGVEPQLASTTAQLVLLRKASSLLTKLMAEAKEEVDPGVAVPDEAAAPIVVVAPAATPLAVAWAPDAVDKERRKRVAAERERDQAMTSIGAMRRTSPIKTRKPREFFGR